MRTALSAVIQQFNFAKSKKNLSVLASHPE